MKFENAFSQKRDMIDGAQRELQINIAWRDDGRGMWGLEVCDRHLPPGSREWRTRGKVMVSAADCAALAELAREAAAECGHLV